MLPAEYGIDPLGTGRALGLTDIASPPVAPREAEPPKGAALAPAQNGPLGVYPAAFNFDIVRIALAPYEYVEYKYRLEKDATMLYSWSASAPVRHDMHGERAAGGRTGPAEQSFDKQTGARRAAAWWRRLPAFTAGTGRIPAGRPSPSLDQRRLLHVSDGDSFRSQQTYAGAAFAGRPPVVRAASRPRRSTLKPAKERHMIRPTVVLAFALLLLAPATALRAHDNYRIIGTVAQVTKDALDVKQTQGRQDRQDDVRGEIDGHP